MILNQVTTVVAEQKGLGRKPGWAHIPALDYGQENNFGGLALDAVDQGIRVPVTLLDTYRLQACDFLKIDVEGMECQVLEGAADTLARHKPVIYVENDRPDKSAELIEFLWAFGYRLHWHLPPLFVPDNYAGNPRNVFGDICSRNMLCLPKEAPPIPGMREVRDASEFPYVTSN
jgi:hypothetical protein